MTDDEVVEGEVVEPSTAVVPYAPGVGEVVDLSDRPKVAATIRELVDWQALVLRPLLDELQAAMISEADTQGQYTLRYGRLEVKVDGPDVTDTEWQADLQPMLTELVLAGLPEDRAAAVAVETRVWKVNRTELNRVAKNPAYRAIIDRYRTVSPKKRRAGVRRTGG